MTIQNWSDVGIIIFLAAGNLYFGLKRQRNATIAAESAAMSLLRGTVQTYKEEVDKLREEMHAQDNRMAALQATISEKEKQLGMFERIFQNRNPEMELFMKNTSDAIAQFQEYIKAQVDRTKFILDTQKEQSASLKLAVELLTKMLKIT
jgi:hypothetical protein